MIETTVVVEAPGGWLSKPDTPPAVRIIVTISLFDAKCAITDTHLRDALAARVSDVASDAVWQYFNSPEGRDEVWALDNSTHGAGTPAPTAEE